MRRLSRPRRVAIAAIALLFAAVRTAIAQNVYVANGTSTTWGKNTAGSWTGPTLYPGLSARGNGGGTATDIAEYLAAGDLATTPRNISFDATGSYGVGATLTVGAIVYAPTTNDGTNAFAFSTLSSSATAGTLSFTGASLYGASNVILANRSAGSATMTINGTASPAMSLGLAAGVNTIVAGAGTATGYGDSIVLNCAIAGSGAPGGSSITFLGGGSASVDGGTLAFDTAPSAPTVTGITVGASDGSNAGRLRFVSPNGMPAGSAGILVNANSQLVLVPTAANAVFGTAAQTITLNGAGTHTDAGALLFNATGTGKTTSLAANVLLASDSAIGVTDSSSTSPTNKLILSGSLSGSSTLTKTGNGILALSGTNHLTGGTVVNAGILQVNAGSSLGTGDLTFAPTGTGTCGFDFNTGGQVTAGNLSSAFRGTAATAESIQLEGNTTLVLVQTASTQFSSALSGQTVQITGLGGIALSAASTGTLTLGIGQFIYGGDTTVDGGTLNVVGHLGNGPLDSPTSAGQVIVHAGGTLSGTGQIASNSTSGAVFLNGGTLSPGDAASGNGVGTLSLTSLVLGTGSIMNFQIGTVSDQVQVSQYLFKSADATGQFQIGFSDAGGLSAGTSYLLATFAPNQAPGAGLAALSASDFQAVARGNLSDIQGTFTLDNTTGQFRFTPTGFSALSPTPATPAPLTLLLGAGIGALCFGRKRRPAPRDTPG